MAFDEEEIAFSHAESDNHVSAKASRSRRRVEKLLRHRERKRYKLLKSGQTNLAPWLQESAIRELREGARSGGTGSRNHRAAPLTRQGRKDLKPVPWRKLQPLTLIDAWVPFTDGTDYKRRPAVVVSADRWDVTVFPLTTTKSEHKKVPMVPLSDWEGAGLSRACSMIWRPVTIPITDVIGYSGELQGADRSQFYSWTRGAGQTSVFIKMHQASLATAA